MPVASTSQPPVSTRVNRVPVNSASYATRSRVTPGTSSTTASRRPRIRLTSVDLPTLGRPMIATTGTGPVSSASTSSSPPRSSSDTSSSSSSNSSRPTRRARSTDRSSTSLWSTVSGCSLTAGSFSLQGCQGLARLGTPHYSLVSAGLGPHTWLGPRYGPDGSLSLTRVRQPSCYGPLPELLPRTVASSGPRCPPMSPLEPRA